MNQSPVTKDDVCNKTVDIHNTENADWLGAADVTLEECQTALTTPLKYTTVGQLNDWSGRHCGTWTIITGSSTNLHVLLLFHRFLSEDMIQRTQLTTKGTRERSWAIHSSLPLVQNAW